MEEGLLAVGVTGEAQGGSRQARRQFLVIEGHLPTSWLGWAICYPLVTEEEASLNDVMGLLLSRTVLHSSICVEGASECPS